MEKEPTWTPGTAPVAVIMLTLNEAHNLEATLSNLKGWANEVFILDSFSSDETVSIALKFGVKVLQRKFVGFGDQWNFALQCFPITSKWTMKLDPDERLSDELKSSIINSCYVKDVEGLILNRRLWFMNTPLPVVQKILRVWLTGSCRFTDVPVNEHPVIIGSTIVVKGYLEHFDSPDLDHWLAKQNHYTTKEAINQIANGPMSAKPRIFGSHLERRMWFKKYFWKFPCRYQILFVYHYLILGSWKAGRVGWVWSHLRTEVYRLWEYKVYECKKTGMTPGKISIQNGPPDSRIDTKN